jgi:hypothetical protein
MAALYLENLIFLEGTMEPMTPIEPQVSTVREIIIGNTKYIVKSVFADKIKLEDAIRNIALKKQRKNSQPEAG